MAVVKDKQAASVPARASTKAVVVNALPFVLFLAAYALAPRYAEDKALTTLIYIGINVLLALGLNLLMGYAGQISLGHAAFFGMGAYVSAILTIRPIAGEVIPGFSVGMGALAGTVMLVSLARVAGWGLCLGVVALFVLSWISRLLHVSPVFVVPLFAFVLGLLGLAVRVDWRRSACAGAVGALVWLICQWFLEGVLARGGASPWTGIVVGVVFTGAVAYLIGSQVLQLKGHYLAMATLGFGIIVEIVFRQWTAVTGGSSDGIFGIPTIQVIDSLPGAARRLIEWVVGGEVGLRQQYFYLVWGLVFIALLLAHNIVRSRIGRAFRAVHGSEIAAESLGVDTGRYKIQVFVLSAALASVAGSLHAHNAGIGYINPSEFGFMFSIQLVVMVVIGGLASVWGSLFGATVIQLLKNALLNLDKSELQLFGITLKGLDPIVFGGVLIAVMILMPQGLVRGTTDTFVAFWRAATRARGRAS